jgi:hypothetical protein
VGVGAPFVNICRCSCVFCGAVVYPPTLLRATLAAYLLNPQLIKLGLEEKTHSINPPTRAPTLAGHPKSPLQPPLPQVERGGPYSGIGRFSSCMHGWEPESLVCCRCAARLAPWYSSCNGPTPTPRRTRQTVVATRPCALSRYRWRQGRRTRPRLHPLPLVPPLPLLVSLPLELLIESRAVAKRAKAGSNRPLLVQFDRIWRRPSLVYRQRRCGVKDRLGDQRGGVNGSR